VNAIVGSFEQERSQSPEKRLKSTIVLATLQQALGQKRRPQDGIRRRRKWRKASVSAAGYQQSLVDMGMAVLPPKRKRLAVAYSLAVPMQARVSARLRGGNKMLMGCCSRWRFFVEELRAVGAVAHLSEPAETACCSVYVIVSGVRWERWVVRTVCARAPMLTLVLDPRVGSGRRLQRDLQLLASEPRKKPPHPGAVRRAYPRATDLAAVQIDPLRSDLRPMLVYAHHDRHLHQLPSSRRQRPAHRIPLGHGRCLLLNGRPRGL
jgi:hypothetical protein